MSDFLDFENLVLREERLQFLRGVSFIIVRMLCAFGVASGGVEGRREGWYALCLLFLIFKCYSLGGMPGILFFCGSFL